jgi:hypothetical protein
MLVDQDAPGGETRDRPTSLSRRTVVIAGVAALIAGGSAAFRFRRTDLDSASATRAEISPEERRKIEEVLSSHPSLTVTRVLEPELERAIASMRLPSADEAALRAAIRAQGAAPASATGAAASPAGPDRPVSQDQAAPKPLPLAWITLSDFRDEDGDVILIETAGYRRVVPLYNAPTTIAIPLGKDSRLTLTGQKDGFGGITVAIGSGSAPPARLVLSEGQSVQLRLKVE